MKKIEKNNNDLLKKDIESMYKIFKDLIKEKEKNMLMLGWFQYFILICIEGLKYVDIQVNFKYKKAIENCRARMKPLEIEYEKMYQQMEKLNFEKMEEFEGYVNKGIRSILKKVITNYGVYSTNDKIIGNTFLYESIYKKIIYENGNVSKDKIIEISAEIGKTIAVLVNYFNLRVLYDGTDRNINIKNRDYNVFKENNTLFKSQMNTNDGLIILNLLCTINFYIYVISFMLDNKELKYRLGYIVYDNTYNNMIKILDKINDNKLNKMIEKYRCLNNKDFRNCMFHYNLTHCLEENEIKEEMYYGIISKYLKIHEETYIKLIDEYMKEIACVLEENILR